MLEVVGLRKSYGETVAVADATFCVDAGMCYGLLGPNGAGKTTVISIITGTLDADGGRASLEGDTISTSNPVPKRKIGYVPQEIAVYSEINAVDNLRFFGSLYGLEGQHLDNRIEYSLELTGLTDRAKEPVANYSGGMKRRLNIAAALLHEPELLILDEPTVGVDPQSRNAIFDALIELGSRGKTILYTTHYMEEVERLCQRVAIMDKGRVIANETLSGMQRLLPRSNEVTVELEQAYGLAGPIAGTMSHSLNGCTLTLEIEDLNLNLPIALNSLTSLGICYQSIQTRKGTLEEVFLHLTGKSLRD